MKETIEPPTARRGQARRSSRRRIFDHPGGSKEAPRVIEIAVRALLLTCCLSQVSDPGDDTATDAASDSSLTMPGDLLPGEMSSAPCSGPRREIWLLSTRSDKRCCGMPVCHQFLCGQGWQEKSLDEFFATSDPNCPTVIFFHGGRASQQDAVDMGWDLWRQLSRVCPGMPLRYVIYTWPAARTEDCLMTDLRMWAGVAIREGSKLARVLGQFDSQSNVCLVGHSFGCRVIGSGLATLSRMPQLARCQTGFQVVFIAAAVDSDALSPGHFLAPAWQSIDNFLLVYNPQDVLLKRYFWLDREADKDALGATGLPAISFKQLPPGHVRQCSSHDVMGHHHRWQDYAETGQLGRWVAPYVWCDPSGEMAVEMAVDR
jgi:hypothetical protein